MNSLVSIPAWIIGITLLVVLFPVSLLIWLVTMPFDRERITMHCWLVFQANLITWLLPIWRIKVEGREKAEKGKTYVIISNHQSLLDIMILNRLWLKFRWISKIENHKVPVIGWYLRMAKYITIDRGNKESRAEMLAQSAKSLRDGISIMIFPEGTRSPDNQIGPFKMGAFELALITDKPIIPVVIEGTWDVLPKHGLSVSGGHKISVKVLDPVYPGYFGTADPAQLAAKFRMIISDELIKIRGGLQ